MASRTELTWSLMHPVKPEVSYMREVVAAADAYDVDGFEICGECHTPAGGLDGVIPFKAYPAVAARRDREALAARAATLREIVEAAHRSGRPVIYWHREVTVPEGMIEAAPDLLDSNGEFDLLGDAYHALLRHKIAGFFEAVPEMDGLVLTLTESEYSVIHNSRPDRYPGPVVVERIVRTFAQELSQRNKRLVLRTFGSIPRDYEDILDGAARLAGEAEFEIETKITPYDFSPFQPHNPWLRPTPGARTSAECEALGEFLGTGLLPAADPERIIRDVAYARSQHVDRFAVRVDRMGRSGIHSAYGVNLLAFTRAIRDSRASADGVWREWAAARWPGVETEMIELMKPGIEAVKKSHFIAGHLIFHTNPPTPMMKWLKAGGIFAVFHPGADLARQRFNWGILCGKSAPSHEEILREKDEAVQIAEACLGRLARVKERLPAAEYERVASLWQNAAKVTRWMRGLCRCICAYFEDMESGAAAHPRLDRAMESARTEFLRHLDANFLAARPLEKPATWYDDETRASYSAPIEDHYARPIWILMQSLQVDYAAEYAARQRWLALPGVEDFVVCGGLADEHRAEKYMHGCYTELVNGRPARVVGNHVFANGYLKYQMSLPARGGRCRLLIEGDPTASPGLKVTVNGVSRVLSYDARGVCEMPVENEGPFIEVCLEKSGASYPRVFGLATAAALDARR